MIELGSSSLTISFIISAFSLIALIIGTSKKDWRFVEAAIRGTKAVTFFMSISVGILIYAFVTNEFSIEYVSNYSEISLPLFYKITGLWAGQKGSLLFWGWLLAVYTYIVAVKDEKNPGATHLPYVLTFLNITVLFFLFLINFVTLPFELGAIVPGDGGGLNPLLQNPGMVFHPPTLYLGYVGFAVPFSYAMAALVTGKVDDWWIKRTRAWTLFSWLFLTLGIVFGGWWAYRELGWGGVWGWDPVENASLMPWFTATAFLHSVMIQERRGMLKIWNLILIILTFGLSIFGTFITRSGIITSVHAFGQSSVGYVFLGFLVVILAVSGYLVLSRYSLLKEHNPKMESLVSKESSFLYNNIILVGLCFATFWGTVFPLISEAVKGVKISVGPPFFNTVNSPLLLMLVVLMAICPLLGWRRTSMKGLIKNLMLPTSLMVLSLPAIYMIGVNRAMPLFFYSFSLFVIVTITHEFYTSIRVALRDGESGWISILLTLAVKNSKRYGGFLIHVGVIFIVVGLAGYGYHQFKEDFTMKPGQQVVAQDYTLKYIGLQGFKKSTYEGVVANMEIYDADGFVRMLTPERRFYSGKEPTTEVAIMSNLKEDLYLILRGWEADHTISLTVVVNPLLMWVWIGTTTIVFGTLWAVLLRRRKDTETEALAVDFAVQTRSES